VFSKEIIEENISKKKVSFCKTVTNDFKENKGKAKKTDTIKKSSSYSNMNNETINKISLGNFENFFDKFMKQYAEEGYMDFGQNDRKVVHIMETRISDDEEGGTKRQHN
jgi:hypothetical protein